MSAYIVSWGVINQGNYMETDSIVHTDEAQARQDDAGSPDVLTAARNSPSWTSTPA